MKTENNEHINLKVAGQDGSVVQFKIKRHTPLNKLMKAYCERQVSRSVFYLVIVWSPSMILGCHGPILVIVTSLPNGLHAFLHATRCAVLGQVIGCGFATVNGLMYSIALLHTGAVIATNTVSI